MQGGPHHLFDTARSLPAPLLAHPIPATVSTSFMLSAAHRCAPRSTVETAYGVSGRKGEI